ncbi:MAG: DUF3455 domain-containing protein [Candidatus Korobacteraceae bacterium]
MSHGDMQSVGLTLGGQSHNRATCARWFSLGILIFVTVFCRDALAQDRPAVPESIKVPSERHLVFRGHALGDQVYACQPSPSGDSQFAWVLSAPDAKLFDDTGKEIATHFAGPTWQSTDGSQVRGKVLAQSVPDSASIPWLLLNAVDHSGTGVMSNVVTIQRLDTKGGKAPAIGCDAQHAGEKRRVNYTADYYFYSAAK